MRYWVVKGKPREFAEDSYYQFDADGQWWTLKPPKGIAKGDRLFFWKSSPARKLVMLGEFEKTLQEKDAEGYTYLDVVYLTPLLNYQLTIEELRRHFFDKLPSFLKAGPAGTFFPLTDEQGEELYRLVVQYNPEVKGVWLDINAYKEMENLPDIDISATEGKVRLVTHLKRERNQKIILAKKTQVLSEIGKLKCEVCGFDFEEVYGEKLGRGYCEVHHKRPISEYDGESETKLGDLAIICSNCH